MKLRLKLRASVQVYYQEIVVHVVDVVVVIVTEAIRAAMLSPLGYQKPTIMLMINSLSFSLYQILNNTT